MPTAKKYLDLIGRGPAAGGNLESVGGGTAVLTGENLKTELLDRLRTEIDYLQRKTGIKPDEDEQIGRAHV